MSGGTVRPAGPHDIAAITNIYAAAVRQGTATFEIDPPDEAEMARRQQVLLTSGYLYLVAEQAGVVAGYAYAGAYHPRPRTVGRSRTRSMSLRNSTAVD